MFRDREYLIEQGVAANSRADTFYIIGNIYDKLIENNKIFYNGLEDEIEELRKYVDEHREIIDDKKYSIVLVESVLSRLREDLGCRAREKYEYGDLEFEVYIDDELVRRGKVAITMLEWMDFVKDLWKDTLNGSEEYLCCLLREAKQQGKSVKIIPVETVD